MTPATASVAGQFPDEAVDLRVVLQTDELADDLSVLDSEDCRHSLHLMSRRMDRMNGGVGEGKRRALKKRNPSAKRRPT